MVETTYSLAFRIMGRDLDPDRISRRLNLVPDEEHRSGEARKGKTGESYAPFKEGLWCVRSHLAAASTPEEQAIQLLDLLVPRSVELDKLRSLGYRLDFFLGIFSLEVGNCGFSLSAETLSKLGELGIALELDIYG